MLLFLVKSWALPPVRTIIARHARCIDVFAGPTFTDPNKRLSLPSTRLGSSTRMHAFSLGPAPSAGSSDTPVPYSGGVMSPPPGGNLPRAATLRKSFRKTLKTHLGFRVRMRSVFVPYFLLPQNSQNGKVRSPKEANGDDASDSGSDIDDDILEEQEQREARQEIKSSTKYLTERNR